MSNAHRILAELKQAREQTEGEKREWQELVRQCRAPGWLAIIWLMMFLFAALIGAVFLIDQPSDLGRLNLIAFAFLAITSPMLFVERRRKEKVLLALIRREAPDLWQRMEDEGIA